MNIKTLKIEEITKDFFVDNKLNNAILYYIDRLEVTNSLTELNINNLIEFRLFNKSMEVKGIKLDNEFKIILREESLNDITIEDAYILEKTNFEKILVKKHLEFDKDGQYYIEYIRPIDII